jgi:hypothetical protein
MLMTVLKGDLAVQQSMALIRLFKQMKDYIVAENQLLLGNNSILFFAVAPCGALGCCVSFFKDTIFVVYGFRHFENVSVAPSEGRYCISAHDPPHSGRQGHFFARSRIR